MEPEFGAVPRDARMLVLFDEIYRAQSMTRAADRLGVSQPTASIWLAKLRRQWHDPLFVRTSAGMQPTPRADALIGPAREALALLRGLSGGAQSFDPGSAQRKFRICMTDASHITLLPGILAHVRGVGPNVGLDVANISSGTAHMLETGEADLALGYIPGLEAGFHEQPLYTQDFICLVNAGHPRVGAVFTARAFKEEGHIGILVVDQLPDAARRAQEAGHRTPRATRIARIPGTGRHRFVHGSGRDRSAHHRRGARADGADPDISRPVKIPTFTVNQYWHARYHHDPGVRWLRSVCAQLLARKEPSRRKAQAAS